MKFTAKIIKIGDSVAVTIPAFLRKFENMEQGAVVDVEIKGIVRKDPKSGKAFLDEFDWYLSQPEGENARNIYPKEGVKFLKDSQAATT